MFIDEQLFQAGEWPTRRTLDGLAEFGVVERNAQRVRLRGRIWRIEQTLHVFWLDVSSDDDSTEGVSFSLFFDYDGTARQKRMFMVGALNNSAEIPFRVELRGKACQNGNELAVVAGSARVVPRPERG